MSLAKRLGILAAAVIAGDIGAYYFVKTHDSLTEQSLGIATAVSITMGGALIAGRIIKNNHPTQQLQQRQQTQTPNTQNPQYPPAPHHRDTNIHLEDNRQVHIYNIYPPKNPSPPHPPRPRPPLTP
ncbi:hypothetical protein HYW75_04265 [Candidatus Pacearchaeota archaeon]|nr:hypothetical protein [Candidatus Pacearchaeota archaeon]